MTTSIPPKPRTIVPIDETPEFGPRDEYELRLFDLIQEGLNSGVPIEISIPEFIADLRRRLHQ